MPKPKVTGSRSGVKNQAIGKASSYSKPTGQRKAAPARSNAGGALRGQARAAQVKTMNAAKRKPGPALNAAAMKSSSNARLKAAAAPTKPKGPTHGSKVSAASRLKARGLVKKNGVIYSKRTGRPVGRPTAAQAPSGSKPRSSGISPLDFLGGAGLMNRNTEAIRRATSRR